ncbi:carboxymuconolactone decarboxylase family protein [Conexibacter sp. SYSU D00693]|uniref:carboxymuconolactone decarboxylase family protein n=1 Tax=Conexibacter sp. SYSU D00693 TaxID=2812560 RepID=UPI00196B4024|nr:carboxymuconolactone decarboxylase family protein [Conexibacter sp. SYSU D00693]
MASTNGSAPRPRVAPGGKGDLGLVNFGITRLLGLATGGAPPNLFTTLGRHRGLFRRWLMFAGALMPGGRLPRRDAELLILRVAHTTGCAYEWHHHERLGKAAGLTDDDLRRVQLGTEAPGWSARQQALLRAADELLTDKDVSDATWAAVAEHLTDERERIELCLLVGHYEMLAMTLNALRVQQDPLPSGPPSRALRMVQSLADRRARATSSTVR